MKFPYFQKGRGRAPADAIGPMIWRKTGPDTICRLKQKMVGGIARICWLRINVLTCFEYHQKTYGGCLLSFWLYFNCFVVFKKLRWFDFLFWFFFNFIFPFSAPSQIFPFSGVTFNYTRLLSFVYTLILFSVFCFYFF